MSIFNFENTLAVVTRYERLYNHPEGETWRVILGEDDYDYIEDSRTIVELELALVEQQIRKLKQDCPPMTSEVEDGIAEEAGLLRGWDHITEEYTETQLEWLERVLAYWKGDATN